jgi:hypothetical protein
MVQEVLRNNIHLLAEDEKTYMGTHFNITVVIFISFNFFLSDNLNNVSSINRVIHFTLK